MTRWSKSSPPKFLSPPLIAITSEDTVIDVEEGDVKRSTSQMKHDDILVFHSIARIPYAMTAAVGSRRTRSTSSPAILAASLWRNVVHR
jgi:hypothetical protein